MLPEHPELMADAPTVAVSIQHVSSIKSVLKQQTASSHGREPGLVPGHELILCFPQSRHFPSFLRRVLVGALLLGLGVTAGAFPEASMAHPAPRAGEEGWSVSLRKEIPSLQPGGFNPQLTELSMAHARLLQRST